MLKKKNILLNKFRTTNEELQKIQRIFVEDVIMDLTSPKHLLLRNHTMSLYELSEELEKTSRNIKKWILKEDFQSLIDEQIEINNMRTKNERLQANIDKNMKAALLPYILKKDIDKQHLEIINLFNGCNACKYENEFCDACTSKYNKLTKTRKCHRCKKRFNIFKKRFYFIEFYKTKRYYCSLGCVDVSIKSLRAERGNGWA